ncbi:GNA1162 family protein [candidate division CSSED10-310 bacterium]|uniref:GNA1162 family protein n=1 Tax=candidate division CSSED10-310 bacterium TaxID=2855610 RepID=A0ABV6Z1Y7_UNCC1
MKLCSVIVKHFLLIIQATFLFYYPMSLFAVEQKDLDKEVWWVHPDYSQLRPHVIAVLPMVNMTFEPGAADILQKQVYLRLKSKGYQKIEATQVAQVMDKIGIQTPEQLSGISYKRLGQELNCQAVIQGQVNQSARQHKVVYDAVVVSCSLQLIECATGSVLWKCEQFRSAHRQWQLDPFNMLLNALVHGQDSREDRIAWLVQEMLRSLPQGPVVVVNDNLLQKAQEIKLSEPKEQNKKEDE